MSRLAWMLALVLLPAGLAGAQPVPAGGTLFDVPVKSLVELRFENVVRQQHDLSCGAAALATLLRHYHDEEIDEQAVIQGIFEFGDEQKISRSGFSMQELKRYAEGRGYVVQGYRLAGVEVLQDLKLPFLTLIQLNGYDHFVVIRGAERDTVFVADPAFGNLRMNLGSFDRAWKKVALFAVDPAVNEEIARTGAIPPEVLLRTTSFIDDGRVLRARSEDVPTLTDFGFRPMQPGFGVFR